MGTPCYGRIVAKVRLVGIALGVLLLTTGTGLAPVPASTRAPSPGAAGIGDPYLPLAGNGGYNVTHYDLDVTYEPSNRSIQAQATIDATATQDLSSFHLDLEGLTVDSVTVDAAAATFTRELEQELIITPAAPIMNGGSFVVVVDYHGEPLKKTVTSDGMVLYGEPKIAQYWFPSNDHPSDKATFDIHLTVPDELETVSNGRLVSLVAAGPNDTTWSWQMTSPMATYLAIVAIGKFTFAAYDFDGIHVLDAVDPKLDASNAKGLAKEPTIVRFLAGRFGPYPFQDVGGIIDRGNIAYALETQGRPLYPQGVVSPQDPLYVVHELAHMWFGDDVALERWQDIWLNEGFASYAEWLWIADRHNVSTRQILGSYCAAYADSASFWKIRIGDPGRRHLFAWPVYARGAMTLEALRKRVGTGTFFDILQTWAQDHSGGNANTDDFVALAELTSGRDLTTFFDVWLFRTRVPGTCRQMAGAGPQLPDRALPLLRSQG